MPDPSSNLSVRELSTETLLVLAEFGDIDACHELDRRGVEPPIVEPGPPPIAVVAV